MSIAAGGIVEKQTSDGLKITIVYRERYGPEWSLPKGKINPDESLEDAALREVYEETSCIARIKRYVGTIDYLVEGIPKVVFFWIMSLEKENSFQESEETKQILWLSPKEAMKRLTHQNQRDILEKAYSNQKIFVKGKIMTFFIKGTKRWKRLASSINSYRNEIDCLEKLASAESKCINCFNTARNLLDEAQARLEDGYVDWGWKLFHAARRMELISLCSEEQRRTNARQILQEASKIKGWRGEAIKKLVEFEREPPKVEALIQAALLRDEHFNNNAYKDSLLKTQSLILSVILIAVLIVLLIWLASVDGLLPAIFDKCEEKNKVCATTWQILFTVGLFGLLGGVISAIVSYPKSPDVARIPEMTSTFRVTFLRLITGFASAIVIIIALQSGLGSKILAGVFAEDLAQKIKASEPYTSYFIAFCAGFSERFVKRAVEYVAGK